MTCEQVEREDLLDAYIAGTLPEDRRERFEEHFFHCDRCLEMVEAARLVRRVLAQPPIPMERPARRWWIPLAAAAAIAVGAFAFWQSTGHPAAPAATDTLLARASTQPDYDLLARFDPPPYRPTTYRGAEKTTSAFAAAMKSYLNRDFTAAAAGLRTELRTNPGKLEGRYYLGLSQLLSQDPKAAAADLRRVLAAGDTPFRSEAHWYLAKALIAMRDVPAAQIELRALVQEQSEMAPQAAELLRRLTPNSGPSNPDPSK